MTATTARKQAIVTSQVQTALTNYASVRDGLGLTDTTGHEFDKGLRGKGFAQYDSNGQVVRTFETKDEAYALYNGWVTVAAEVLKALDAQSKVADKPAKKDAQKDAA